MTWPKSDRAVPLYGPGRLIDISRRSLGPLNEEGDDLALEANGGRASGDHKSRCRTCLTAALVALRQVLGESAFADDSKARDAPGAVALYERYPKNGRSFLESGM